MYKFKKYEGSQIDWDKKITENKGNYRQLFSWGQYKKECGWDVLRYVAENKKNSFHIQILMKSFWTVVFIYVPGGISDGQYGTRIDVKKILSYIKPYSIKYIRIDSNYKIDSNFNHPQGLRRPIYRLNSSVSMNHNLENEADLFKKASSKWKYNIRKSLSYNVRSEISDNISLIDVVNLTQQMNKLKKLNRTDDPNDFEKLFKNFDYKTLVCKCYDKNDKIIGFRSALIVNDIAWDYYAAANLSGRKLRVGYLTLYNIMNYCKDNGIKFYNLGAIDEKRNLGVAKFKKNSGGDLYNYVGEWNCSNLIGITLIVNIFMYLFFKIRN